MLIGRSIVGGGGVSVVVDRSSGSNQWLSAGIVMVQMEVNDSSRGE